MNAPVVVANIDSTLFLFSREGNKRKVQKVTTFKPYFLILAKHKTAERSIFGEYLKRVYAKKPQDVPQLRKKFEKTYEADIPYVRRFLIDEFKTPFPLTSPRVLYLDVEVADSLNVKEAPEPVISITLYDNFTKQLEAGFFLPGTLKETTLTLEEGKSIKVNLLPSENLLFAWLVRKVLSYDPDLLVGWNLEGFDWPYLFQRAKHLNLDLSYLSPLEVVTKSRIKGRVLFDLMRGYAKLTATAYKSFIALEEACREGIGKGKLNLSASIKELWEEGKWEEIVRYNAQDVSLMVELDSKLGVISFFNQLRCLAGVEWEALFSNKTLVDTLLLRELNPLGIRLPTSNKSNKEGSYTGGFVWNPTPGLYENVIVLDVKSMYPSIIISFNLSPELINKGNSITTPFSLSFPSPLEEEGVYRRILKKLMEERAKYKKAMRKAEEGGNKEKAKELYYKQYAIKVLLNSFYGVLGYKNFRLFNKKLAETITTIGREIFMWIKERVEEMGYEFVYGDTDSSFVKLPSNLSEEGCVKLGKEIAEEITRSFDVFASKYGVKNHVLKLEFEKYFKRLALLDSKRYVGWVRYKDGVYVDEIEVKGVEMIKSDRPEITKFAWREVLIPLLRGETSKKEAWRRLKEIRKDILEGKVEVEKILIPMRLKPLSSYKGNPAHKLGVFNAIKLGLLKEAPVGLVYVAWITHPKLERNVEPLTLPPEKISVLQRFKRVIKWNKHADISLGTLEDSLKKLTNETKDLNSFFS